MIEIEARKGAASHNARLDAVFAALADPTRRAIIERLSRSGARVTEVAAPFHMSLNAVSKHIRVLEASGVVERRRKGRDHILSINIRSLDEVDGWIERTRHCWDERLDGAPAARDQEGPQVGAKGSQAWFAVRRRVRSCRYAGA
jgi:DNA-binding transcriptional ArsR family regulator